MINCNQPNCKNHRSCNLKQPMTPYTAEINYWLKELRLAEKRINEYADIVLDIVQYHKYSIPVNVYGRIEYAPKTNAFGVFIRRPEHVMYGWNLRKLENKRDEVLEKIRTLRHDELELIRDGNIKC